MTIHEKNNAMKKNALKMGRYQLLSRYDRTCLLYRCVRIRGLPDDAMDYAWMCVPKEVICNNKGLF